MVTLNPETHLASWGGNLISRGVMRGATRSYKMMRKARPLKAAKWAGEWGGTGHQVRSNLIGRSASRAGRTASWLGGKGMAHPALTLGAAAAFGAWRAHPWQSMAGIGAVVGVPTSPFATGSAVSDMLLGDPDAGAKMTQAAWTKAVATEISPIRNPGVPFTSMAGAGYLGSPSGSLVFGLYNDRLK